MTDGADHHIVVNGRRWRATDPRIPADVRQELVDELMAGRRLVGAARRVGDSDAEAAARRRVHDAKVALGERGEPWWDTPSSAHIRQRSLAVLRALRRSRGPTSAVDVPSAVRVAGAGHLTDVEIDDVVREIGGLVGRSSGGCDGDLRPMAEGSDD